MLSIKQNLLFGISKKDKRLEMGSKCSKGEELPTDAPRPSAFSRADVALDEFEVLPESKIANYDHEELSRFWNEENKNDIERRNFFKKLASTWKKGIWGASCWVICFYVIAYYVINVLVIQIACARDYPLQYTMQTPFQELMLNATLNQNNATLLKGLSAKAENMKNTNLTWRERLNTTKESVKTHGCRNYEQTFAAFAMKEAQFTRLFTFLLGFYVSFTINRWWKQITSVPCMDNLCVSLAAFVWVNPSMKEDEVYVKEGVNVKQFKHTIARYLLLSWSMVMSRVGKPLEDKLKQPLDFNEKGLITFEEYASLKTKHGGDAWKGKWSLPLLWASSMICEATEKTKDGMDVKIKELKEIMKAINAFQMGLNEVVHYDANRAPDIIDQAIRVAMWFWIFMGVFSSQGMVNKEFNVPIYGALFMNFPILHIVKYVLLFSWMKTALYLQNPFGNDE